MDNGITELYENLDGKYGKIAAKYFLIEESELDNILEEHSGIYAFFSALVAYAKKIMADTEAKYEEAEASEREKKRAADLSKGKKATDRSLDAYVKTLDSLSLMRKEVRECQYKYNLARGVLSALDHKKDTLIQVSANKRAEAKMVTDLG